jgi:ABC-2 type transport system permease protein
MRTAWIIAVREFKRYFASPIAYVLMAGVLFVMGGLFYGSLQFALASGQGTPPRLQDSTGLLVFLLLLVIPSLTMRLIAEEQRMGTIELMLTAPVKDWEFVLGKWLGGVLTTLVLVAATLVFPLTLNQMVSPGIDQGLLLANYLGLVLVVMALVAIGTMISSFFKLQVAAFLVTLVVVLGLWIIGVFVQGSTNELVTYLDFRQHYQSTFMTGVLDIRDVVYYLSLTAAALFIGSVSVESRRWR